MIKAIETRYKGYRFRSRLEARWAVFFDALGLKWEYEPEGFELGGGVRYLPDFYLPPHHLWVEVKGQAATPRELLLAEDLADARLEKVFLSQGMPDEPGWLFTPRQGCVRAVYALATRNPDAVAAARGARFEHGENGAAMADLAAFEALCKKP